MSGGMITTDVSGKADTVLTTKGDIATWDTKRVRKGVSATNYTGLQADSAIADGLTYGATSRSTLTTTGDMLAASAANTLTRIAGGASGEVLTGNGAGVLPTFQAAAGGGAWVSEGNDVNTSRGDDLSVDVSDADVYQIQYNVSDVDGGTCSLCLRLNDVTTASSYDSLLGTAVDGGALNFEISSRAKWLLTNAGAELAYSGVCYIYKADANFISAAEAGATFTSTTGKNNSTTPYNANFCTGMNNTITGAISNIKLFCMKENTTANEGIIGSMRVNSLSYS